jgi:hypothetical protein
MFEKEVMIAGIRQQRDKLEGLLEILEQRPRFESAEKEHCREVLKRIETTIRRMRKRDGEETPAGGRIPVRGFWGG